MPKIIKPKADKKEATAKKAKEPLKKVEKKAEPKKAAAKSKPVKKAEKPVAAVPKKPKEISKEIPKLAPKEIPPVAAKPVLKPEPVVVKPVSPVQPPTPVPTPTPAPAPAPVPTPVAEAPKPVPAPVKPKENILKISEDGIVLKTFAEKLQIMVSSLIKELMRKGMSLNLNQKISPETAQDLGKIFGWKVEVEVLQAAATKGPEKELSEEEKGKLVSRPPVVVIMGHVDHGKTKLLDAIRKTKVAESEAGGITQHIGAYQVTIKGKKITFLDTPGHEAFTALRARGAKVTDIAVLVVAADDGVMPQTLEAVDHAKAAEVPIIVAINKIDKPEANPDRIKQQLSELGLIPEEWSGTTVMVPVSAKQQTGIDELLEMILLVAEIGELKADPHGKAEGVIIESRLDKGRGPVATVLVRTGTLKVGDIFVSGPTSGRIRALFDDKGKKVNSAPPSMPVEVLGFQDVPNPGNMLKVVESEQEAREIAEKNLTKQKKANRIAHSLADFSLEVEKGEKKNLNLVLKADVRGSLDALVKSLGDIDVSGLHVNILHRGIGNITESDVLLAEASNAIVAGFNVEMESRAREIAESEGVEVRNYSIIYKMLDDMKLALTGILKPEYEEVIIGVAEVRQTFKYSKLGVIAGSFINSGKFVRGSGLRIFRGKEKVFEGKVESLKRFKDDVKEVLEGYECGVAIQNFTDFKAGDILQCFEMREKAKK